MAVRRIGSAWSPTSQKGQRKAPRSRRGQSAPRQAGSPSNLKDSKPVRRRRGTKAVQASTRKHTAPATRVYDEEDKPRPTAPTPKMVAYAHSLARGKKVTLPEGYERDFKACRRFLDEHAWWDEIKDRSNFSR